MVARTQKSASRKEKIKKDLESKNNNVAQDNDYSVGAEKMTVESKLALLKKYGREELADLFRDEWKPRKSPAKKRGAPLDQRVTITVTDAERASLNAEIEKIKSIGDKTSMAEIIRSRAIGSVDAQRWKSLAEEGLKELDEIEKNKSTLEAEKAGMYEVMDEEEDPDEAFFHQKKIDEIKHKLSKLVAQNVKRNNRLSGRMSTAEAETVKWRAQRLCISASDFLRMMIFALEPNSHADSHMSLDAKRRFYISIIDVADNGWGTPPKIYHCSQCMNYVDVIRDLRSEIDKLRKFT